MCCKHSTYRNTKPFKCNTYKKHGGVSFKPNISLCRPYSISLPTSHLPYTLPSSLSRKSSICYSYVPFASRTFLRDENCRVCTNNSQLGTRFFSDFNFRISDFAFRISTFNFRFSTSYIRSYVFRPSLLPFPIGNNIGSAGGASAISSSCGYCRRSGSGTFTFDPFRMWMSCSALTTAFP